MVIGLSGVNLWGPICSVITQVFNKMGLPRCGSPICSITSAITDRIGRHEVLSPINHNHYNFREKNAFFFVKELFIPII